MIKQLITTARLKIEKVMRQGKKTSSDMLPRRFRVDADDSPVPAAAPTENLPAEPAATRKAAPRRPQKEKWQLSNFAVEPEPGKVRFHDIGLPLPLMRAIADLDFRYCTPVQAESLPHLLQGRDLVANANTGTGKTAVFLIAILTRLVQRERRNPGEGVQALILAPTRELVIQIAEEGRKLGRYVNLRIAAVYGGTDYQKQMEFCEQGCDIVVATPGRLIDFCGRGFLKLQNCRTVVIDEADRMLDMGFIPDVRRIIGKLPDRDNRQTLMFSATITEEVKRLASQWCSSPVNVAVESEQVAVDTIDQKVYLTTSAEKFTILYNLVKKSEACRIVVFANQKREAAELYARLVRHGIDCTLLTGDVPQKKRMERLERFRRGNVAVLVATDVAGRGLHVEGVTHVVNYSLPYEPEDYVHRIGRTGRAGAAGISISFACEEGSFILPDIEEFIGRRLECSAPEEDLLSEPPKPGSDRERKSSSGRRRNRRRRKPADAPPLLEKEGQ